MKILITGGAGFIGSNFVRWWQSAHHDRVVVLDSFTYAGNKVNLDGVNVEVERVDVADRTGVADVFARHRPEVVVHFAAESHVDRSIHDGVDFARTNVVGTQVLLDAVRAHRVHRFVHVSTDEVYGDRHGLPPADEDDPPRPSSPYAASKAGADHLALAAHFTHRLPIIITRATNNYGPRQFPEKFIPLAVLRALASESIPVYGDGRQVRDWLHVEDHCRAIEAALDYGHPGEIYNVGSGIGRENREVVDRVLRAVGRGSAVSVADRPGHDRRYAVSTSKIEALGWSPRVDFDAGLSATIEWYRQNETWWRPILSGEYRQWVANNYAERGTP